MSRHIDCFLLVGVVAVISLTVTDVSGQVMFQASEIGLVTQAEASDSDVSDSDGDSANAMDITSFMDSITAVAATPTGNGSMGEATAQLSFTSNLVQASGRTVAETHGAESAPANAFGNVDVRLSFNVAAPVEYTADVFVNRDSLTLGTDAVASVRLFDSSGADVFSHTAMPGGPVIEPMMGTLMPDTYTLQALSNSNASAGEIGSGGMITGEFDVTLDFRSPSMLSFGCVDSGFCVEQLVAIPPSMHGIAPGPADEPIPFWVEGLGLAIVLDGLFQFGDGPGIADLAIIDAPFDGPEDMFPDDVYELGTVVRTTLAFKPGSLTGVQQLDDLPPTALVGEAQLLDPNGDVLAMTRLQPVPEPSSFLLMSGVLGVVVIFRRASSRRYRLRT